MDGRLGLRGTTLAREFDDIEGKLEAAGIRSTIVVFGSTFSHRDKVSGVSRRQLSRWYGDAREFGRIVSQRGGALRPVGGYHDNVIATGGGPGLMEAANRGAADAGALTIGFNIKLPHQQKPNPYISPGLRFELRHFAIRKFHLVIRAAALVAFPGGFGTLDELFEILTLIQAHKTRRIPVVCFDKAFWTDLIDFRKLTRLGLISTSDMQSIAFADTPEAAWRALVDGGLPIRKSR